MVLLCSKLSKCHLSHPGQKPRTSLWVDPQSLGSGPRMLPPPPNSLLLQPRGSSCSQNTPSTCSSGLAPVPLLCWERSVTRQLSGSALVSFRAHLLCEALLSWAPSRFSESPSSLPFFL